MTQMQRFPNQITNKQRVNLNLLLLMKKILTLAGLLLYFYGNAQTASVNYTASTAVISNPERGFYKYSSTHSDSYSLLNQTTLNNYRTSQNVTLLYRYFYLEDFRNAPISASYLANMQTDFDRVRNAGMKMIVRFAYSDDEGMEPRDATKSLMLTHINQLKPILIANADVISVMQAGFIGTWGEWYYTSQSEFGGDGSPTGNEETAANMVHRKDILTAILNALPASRQVMIRKPTFKQDMYNTTAGLPVAQAFNGTALARVAHHNDCFLASDNDYGTYENPATEYPYMAQETKFLAMGGETCELNAPRTDCTNAVAEMAQLHWSFLNSDYNTSVLSNFTEDGCMTEIQRRLGYRFELKSGTFPQTASAGGNINFTLKVKNVGFAAPFNERHVYLVLKNTTTNQVYSVQLATDPRFWLGTNEITVTENLQLPSGLTAGNYKLYLNIPDASPSLAARPEYSVRFANESLWETTTGYNNLNHTITVNTALGTVQNTKLNLTIYPVPTSQQLTVEMENIADFSPRVYNSIGQDVKVSFNTEINKMVLETSGLSDGMYFVEFTKDNIRDVRKFIVKH